MPAARHRPIRSGQAGRSQPGTARHPDGMFLAGGRHSTTDSPSRYSTGPARRVPDQNAKHAPLRRPMSPIANKTFDGCPGGLHRLVTAVPGQIIGPPEAVTPEPSIQHPPPGTPALSGGSQTNLLNATACPHPAMRPEPDSLRPAPCATTPHTGRAESAFGVSANTEAFPCLLRTVITAGCVHY